MKTWKLSMSLLLFLLLNIFSTVSVFAADAGTAISEIEIPDSERQEVAVIFRNLGADTKNSRLLLVSQNPDAVSSEKELFKYAPNTGIVTFNRLAFSEATRGSKNKAVEEFVSEVTASKLSLQTQQYLFDRISDGDSDMSRMLIPLVSSGTNTDLFTAFTWISPALPVIRGLLGALTFLLSIFWGVSTVADFIYIGLPWARDKAHDVGDKRGRVWFVSSDALHAVREVETSLGSGDGYRNGYIIYLKRRWLSYIILAVCITYLILGGLGDLLQFMLNLFH